MGFLAEQLRSEADLLDDAGWSCNLRAHSDQADRLRSLADRVEELEGDSP